MEFCPKCGSVLICKVKNSSCPRCGYTKKGTIELSTSEKIDEKQEIAVVKKEVKTEPVVDEVCPKCGHNKAYFWMIQTRASDEAPTKFFKCCKCEYIRRDYN